MYFNIPELLFIKFVFAPICIVLDKLLVELKPAPLPMPILFDPLPMPPKLKGPKPTLKLPLFDCRANGPTATLL